MKNYIQGVECPRGLREVHNASARTLIEGCRCEIDSLEFHVIAQVTTYQYDAFMRCAIIQNTVWVGCTLCRAPDRYIYNLNISLVYIGCLV